ncbi:MAG: response regulator [Candidatus Kariarchaeaceae archaeon]|jgi:FixJ family two-component response regulator
MVSPISYQESIYNSVLIIDDDKSITDAFKRILGKDYRISVANSISEASKHLMEKEFPVILLDYELGESKDGVTFSNQIAKMHPRSYIIMVTGHKDFSLVKRAINVGSINYFIHKPVDSMKLREIVDEAIEKYKSKVELSTFLQNPQGLDKAKSLLSEVISDKMITKSYSTEYEITGIVISKGSIPVYSNFLNEEVFRTFTDTLFAGFMSALVMVGDELFSISKGVESLRFNEISIFFRFIDDYQITFIILTPLIIDEELINPHLDSFADRIRTEVEQDTQFFNWARDNDKMINEMIDSLKYAL